MTTATAPRIAPNPRDQFEILRRYADGADAVTIMRETRLPDILVTGTIAQLCDFNPDVARRLVAERRLHRPDLTLVPAPDDEPVAPEPGSLDELRRQALTSGDHRLTRLADQFDRTATEVRNRLAETAEQARLKAEAAQLETQLAQIRKQLRKLGTPHRRGPDPVQPCGTRAAYNRHKANKEEPCQPCLDARRRYDVERQRAKRTAMS